MRSRSFSSFRAVSAVFALLFVIGARIPRRHAGPERTTIAYDEPHAAVKRRLLARINAERAATGAPPLRYDLVGALAGDLFCKEEAARGFTGHWDLEGRAPYVRWAEAGGLDYHAQNVAGRSRFGGDLTESVPELLEESHRLFMAERSPGDPHRRTVLDPIFTHVGIGVALLGGEFRMTEEFSRQVAIWIEVPEGAQRSGSRATFAAQLPGGWNVGSVEVAYEPPPRPMKVKEIQRRVEYAYPPAIHTLRPFLPAGQTWRDGSRGDFPFSAGRLSLDVPLDHGEGSYIVLVYAAPGSISGRALSPVTAARIEAR